MASTTSSSLVGKTLISVQEAVKAHGDPNVKFVDGSWFLKDRNGREEYEAGPRIQGALYFDIDDIASKGPTLNPKDLKHMMPPKALFAAAMDAMEITNSNHLIVYGSPGCIMIQRAWLQLQSMGHDRDLVHLMQGSLDDWRNAGGPIEEGPTRVIQADELDLSKQPSYQATDAQNIVGLQELKEIIMNKGGEDILVVDVRSSERFLGAVEEPRPGLRLGHMPGALNLPFDQLLRPDNKLQYKPESELRTIFQDAGLDIDTEKRIIVSCGSGASACTLAGALAACGRDPSLTYIYDGSWMEWGAEPDTPIVKGE